MERHRALRSLSKLLSGVDLRLLLCLLLLCHVKLAVKAAGILLLIYWLWSMKVRLRSIPLFYPAMIGLTVLSALLAGRFGETNYLPVFAGALTGWLACGIAAMGMRGWADRISTEKLLQTLALFFVLNALVSFLQLGAIIFETGALNPYRYQGNYQKYFINTGDFIKGISFDTSTTNATINAFAILVFFYRRQWLLLSLCLAALLLAGSNLVNALLLACFAGIFLFKSNRPQKSVLLLCVLPMIVFWARVSPQNTTYMEKTIGRVLGKDVSDAPPLKELPITERDDATLSPAERRQKKARLYLDSVSRSYQEAAKSPVIAAVLPEIKASERPVVPGDSIHTARFQHRDDTSADRKEWMAFASSQATVQEAAPTSGRMPGKIVALCQSMAWMRGHPHRIITGAGPGCFSSKIAFKAAAMNIAGHYPKRWTYINPAFRDNHLALYLSYFTSAEKLHSVVHTPNSVWDQLAAEYGVPGLAAGLFLYFGFFWKRRRGLQFALPLLAMTGALFFMDYWMEQLSVIPLFELLFFIDRKQADERNEA